ncbi:MAG: 8-amino-7-oxononanoate synthase [Desulfobacteraceae bacterium 4572_87]|nr:MAG: 8-amino-7-oxononanoate synthase [Desulfobacteraceae bacterium 4572_87]
MEKYRFIEEELNRREQQSLLRQLRAVTPVDGMELRIRGQNTVNFCSNDYLGLSKHPLLMERAIEFTKRYGTGATASRLVCGNYDCFQVVEEKLAALKGTEAALILNSGFQANVSILPALADRETLILSDELNHNSIVQGALLSRCRILRFRHNDVAHLAKLLRENSNKEFSRCLVVTESVFSVDGDQCHMESLVELAHAFDAFLVVDEAHATGVLGPKGMGLCCGKGVDLTIGTFGKACGSFGAYAACSRKLRDYLVNCCSGFIYTTALPPSVIGSIDAALDLIPAMDNERKELHAKADFLRSRLQNMGLKTGSSNTQIIPVIIGKERDALNLSRHLENGGALATALRPPTVPEGESRIRLALSVTHTKEQLEDLIQLFEEGYPHGNH